jgi:two-component sensor histidine kinase
MNGANAYAARLRSFERFSLAAGAFTALTGGLVLLGWWLDLAALKNLLPGLTTMKPNTGVGFIFLGTALWLAERPPPNNRGLSAAARIVAGVPALLGLLTLAEYFSGRDLHFDDWLFRAAVNTEGGPFPGRMAHATAFNMAMFGLALQLLNSRSWQLQATAQGLGLTGALSGLVATTGYLFGAKHLYSVSAFSSVALHTALLSTLVGFAILAARPSVGVMTAITDNHHGGFVARRVLPATLILPLLNAWLRLKGQQAGLYGTEFGLAIFAMSNVVLFAVLVWWSARSLNTSDAAQRTSEEEVRNLNADLERRVAERTEELATANREIALSLLAKEQLLQETHHRVKNNLALIVSLMRIIEGRSLEGETKSVLKEMQGRIHSVILLNETLYKTASYTRVNLADYLKALATHLFQAQGARTGEVRLVLDLEPVDVQASLAIPCGLLANELMTNSLKHAFPNGERGEVRLGLRRETDGRVRLRVTDTGPGLPQDFDDRRLKSLGMQLVSDLARQVGGPLEIDAGPGAAFSVVFLPELPVA